MSGGSMNYAYSRIEHDCLGKMGDPELEALMKDIVELLHEREWYLSDDTGVDDWEKARDKFKKKWLRGGSSEKRLKKIVEEEVDKLKAELLGMIGEK